MTVVRNHFYASLLLAAAVTPSLAHSNEILCGPNDNIEFYRYFENVNIAQYLAFAENNIELLTQDICASTNNSSPKYSPLYAASFSALYNLDLFEKLLLIASGDSSFDINRKITRTGGREHTILRGLMSGAFMGNASTERILSALELLKSYNHMPSADDIGFYLNAGTTIPNYNFETWKIFADYVSNTATLSDLEINGWPLYSGLLINGSYDQIAHLTKNSDFDPNAISSAGIPYYFYIAGRANHGDYIQVWELLKSLGANIELTAGKEKKPFLWVASSIDTLRNKIIGDNKLEDTYRDFLLYLLRDEVPFSTETYLFSEPMLLVEANLNEPELIEEFLEYTDSINFKMDENGANVITVACEFSTYAEVIELLISVGASANSSLVDKWSCLHLAAEHNPNATEISKILLDNGANINAIAGDPGSMHSVVQRAMFNPHQAYEIFEYLIANGADLNKRSPLQIHPVITAASQALDPRIIEQIYRLGYKMDPTVDYDNLSPLNSAVAFGKTENVEVILKSGASTRTLAPIYSSIGDRVGPLHATAELRNPQEAIDLLLQFGAPIDLLDDKGRTPLIYHIESGNEKGALVLIDRGANFKLKNRDSMDAVLLASESGMYKVLQLLVDRGNILNVRSNSGQTPAMLFCENASNKRNRDNEKIIDLLLSSTANINTRDNSGMDALSTCLSAGNLTTSRQLVKLGAKVTNRYQNGRSILQQVLFKMIENRVGLADIKEVVDFLISQDINLNSQDDLGNTILHDAIYYNLTDVISTLINHGAAGNLKNKNDETAFDLATRVGMENQDLIWILNDLRFQ